MIRAFTAIDVPEHVATMLEEIQADLRIGRPVAPENMHLTLAFLGDQPVPVLEDLHHGLAAIRIPAFELTISGLGVFGGRRPRALFATIEQNPLLAALRTRIRGAARKTGIDMRRERFRPHVTLARFGAGLQGGDLAELHRVVLRHVDFACGPFPVTAFALYRSTLTRAGPVYEEMASYQLELPGEP